MRGAWICSAVRFPLCRPTPSHVWWKPTMSLCRGHRGTAVTIVTVEAGATHSVGGRTCSRPARTTQGVILLTLILLSAALPPGAAAAPDVTLEFWTISLQPFFTDYVNGMIATYERTHPGIRIRWVG